MSKKILDSDIEIASKFEVNSGFTKKLSLRLGKITAVYPEDNTCDIQWMFPNRGAMEKLELCKPYIGFRSGINFIPQVGSLVTVGFAEDLPILLTYFIPTSFSNMLSSIENDQHVKTKIRKLKEGEISINSSEQAEIYFSDTLLLRDTAEDKIVLDPSDGSITINSLQLYLENESGKLTMGMVERDGEIITDDGKSVLDVTGGNALTEVRLQVNKLADNTINSDEVKNEVLADIVVGTKVDDAGKIVKTKDGTQINAEIQMSSGMTLQIDENGKLFMVVSSANINEAIEEATATSSQQRSAREGDRITIPVTVVTQPNQVHPNLLNKSTFNFTQLSQLASCFMSPTGPCIFVPAVTDLKLVGEITQGSSDIFVGSLDKNTETQETTNNTLP